MVRHIVVRKLKNSLPDDEKARQKRLIMTGRPLIEKRGLKVLPIKLTV